MDDPVKAAGRARVAELVQQFRLHAHEYLRPEYNETQARNDFISPLLEALGWDVHNTRNLPLAFRDVIEEATVEVGVEKRSKKPDYALNLGRTPRIFVEAKKPSIRIDIDKASAFQAREYGYSGGTPISILTNFHTLAIYETWIAPTLNNEAHVARIRLIEFEELEQNFDYLWDRVSRHAVYSGSLERLFPKNAKRHGEGQFDEFFLRQVSRWRNVLASDIYANAPHLTSREVTYAVQLFLSRLIFLRICEDRDIERYENLRQLPAGNTFDGLLTELRRADEFYNSGLFDLFQDQGLGIRISDPVLHQLIEELYYPQSKYSYAVVEPEILGEIYEQFLGFEISIVDGRIVVVPKPEVRESDGVFPTPKYIVDAIVAKTLLPALNGKSPAELGNFTILDLCCGSGIFLLSGYDFLMNYYLEWYLTNDREIHAGRTIYEVGNGHWRLTFDEKRRILLAHIRGVDLDNNAVEIAQFSLLLKLIDNETSEELRGFVDERGIRALPSLDETIRCGNSLISEQEWNQVYDEMDDELSRKVNPFDWVLEFPREMERGGFDIVVMNPPYVRIQNMATYSPEEVAFYQSPGSPYLTALHDNFDKYGLFLERSLRLCAAGGRLGTIVPHKFMVTRAGESLRGLLSQDDCLETIVHFGVEPVFGARVSNYTSVLVMNQDRNQTVHFGTSARSQSLACWSARTDNSHSSCKVYESKVGIRG